MKKLILLALGLSALIIFVSCGSVQNVDKKRNPFPGTDSNKISENTALQECLSDTNLDQQNKCLMKLATDMIYYKIYEQDINICKKMSMTLPYYQECYWLFAMTNKDSSVCEFLPKTAAKTELEDQWFSDVSFLTKDNCKNELHFKSSDANWDLIGGIPPWADPHRLFYKGNAVIQGWIVYESGYTEDELIARFHLSDSSKDKLPPTIKYQNLSNFGLVTLKNNKWESLSEEDLSKLKKYSEKSPVTIKINGIEMVMEGPPLLEMVEIIK